MKYTVGQRVFFASFFVVVTAISGIAVAAFTVSNNHSSSSAQESRYVVVELHQDHLTPDSIALKVGQELQIVNRSGESRELFLGAGDAHENHGDNHDDSEGKEEHSRNQEHEHDSGFSTDLIGADEAWQGSFAETGTYFLHDHEKAHINLFVVVYE